MFVLCPHCQFLVALPANGVPPECCPRCDGRLQPQSPAAGAAVAATTGAAATAEAGIGETPVVPAPGSTSIADGGPSQDGDDEPAGVAEADVPGDTTPGAAATEVEVELEVATASGPSTPPLDPQHADASPATPETAVAGAIDGEAAAGQPEPPDPLPVHAASDGHASTAAADTAPADAVAAALPVAAKKPRSARRAAIPSFARAIPTAKPVDRRRLRLESAAIAALSLLLAVQWLLADRARLAADAHWRPLLSTLCGVLGCDLPAWREPLAFTLVERDVRPHPRRAGALRVTATFRNDARWPQPWPGVLLTLSDVDGRVAGARVFAAREYLGAAPTQNELGSGQTASIAMDVVEPTPRIVAFTFDFR